MLHDVACLPVINLPDYCKGIADKGSEGTLNREKGRLYRITCWDYCYVRLVVTIFAVSRSPKHNSNGNDNEDSR